jgi:hypothetical protein
VRGGRRGGERSRGQLKQSQDETRRLWSGRQTEVLVGIDNGSGPEIIHSRHLEERADKMIL